MMELVGIKCHLCHDEALGIFYFSRGCYCNDSKIQPLCLHHSRKSTPKQGGTMQLLIDLTVDRSFERYYSAALVSKMQETFNSLLVQ